MPAGGTTGRQGRAPPLPGQPPRGPTGPFPAVPGRTCPAAGPAPPPPRRLCDVSPRRSERCPPARPGPYLVGGHGAEPLEDGGDVLLAGLAHGAGRAGRAAGGAVREKGRGCPRRRSRDAPPAAARPAPPLAPRAARLRPVAAETGAERGGPGVRGGRGCWPRWETCTHRVRPAQGHGSTRPGRGRGDERARPLNARRRVSRTAALSATCSSPTAPGTATSPPSLGSSFRYLITLSMK